MSVFGSIPLWAVFGLLAAALSASQLLLQEHFKAAPLPMAFWVKVACALAMIPFVVSAGLPTDPVYYEWLAAQSVMWVVSDVIFYRGLNESGAGVITRILPMATLVSFFLWFAIDWDLARAYLARPVHSMVIAAILCLSAFFAWHLKKCAVTRKALRSIWFVLLASIVGALTNKIISRHAGIEQGVPAFVFCEALIMVTMWLVYYAIRRPLPLHAMFGREAIRTGLSAGFIAAFSVGAGIYATYKADNPAYVGAVKYLDSVMIFFFYRAIGRPNQGRVWAGFGIVACAAALVIVKARN